MPTNVIYPKVSLENSSGKISRWLVAEGEPVRDGQVLFEIENDKAAVEVESPADGVIWHLVAGEREVDVGAQVAMIYAADEVCGDVPAKPQEPAGGVAAKSATLRDAASGPLATPLARRIAREKNIRVDTLSGTGPRGRVQKKDVLAHVAAQAHIFERPTKTSALGHVQPTPHRVSDGGLHHVWLRRGTGDALVLLHGFSGDLNNWRGMFAGAGFHAPVLALDLPGHGQSPLQIPADMDGLVAQVEQSIAGLVDGPLVLAGHSFGGTVAARIAARGMLNLRGLCLFAPAGLGPEINGAFTDGILRAREADSLRPWLNELVYDRTVISDGFLRAVVEQRRDQALTSAMRAFADRFLPDGTQSQNILAGTAYSPNPRDFWPQ